VSQAKGTNLFDIQRGCSPKNEVAAIEKAIPFDKKEEIKGGTDGHVLASNLFFEQAVGEQ
jgi:hypothetical protein